MLDKLFRPVAAIALTLGLSASALAAEPLKIGTTSAFAIPLEAAVEEAHKQGLEVKLSSSATGSPPMSASTAATST